MARMIDADALNEYIENEFDGVCVYDVSGGTAAYDFCNMVDNAPTIDAIPVAWLREWQDEVGTINEWWPIIERIITVWHEEQEAR